MMSGDKCHVAGLYWASGCGHADVLILKETEELPNCKTCGKPIKWIYQVYHIPASDKKSDDTLPVRFKN